MNSPDERAFEADVAKPAFRLGREKGGGSSSRLCGRTFSSA